MKISYLRSFPWSRWTRDERFFCSILYSHASSNPAKFADWLIESTGIPAQKDGHWDLGYEVCLYRDYLWQFGKSARSLELPWKRTFDLCLFGTRTLIVIEAKVFERFESRQMKSFPIDRQCIPSLPGLEKVKVYIVALASSKYFENVRKYGRSGTLDVFDGLASWAGVAQQYSCPLLDHAEHIYKLKPGEILGGEIATGGIDLSGQRALRTGRRGVRLLSAS